ncbi:glycosyltransferase [Ichthyenterobacterium magnum]|uniref:Glycosyltransferase involved in cell wall biosynthesis n=1 Tax=Ichthyenterobacterium magnum TaxID=1230530 RepID=A0A420DMA3_9FLAO|nr:glycosyltransferase [Ichthyenterobacterium magnum]RKE95307.1 glycosyltransferase involved in cell wall biosynthesis [Ichthyenterobacterium magnum]
MKNSKIDVVFVLPSLVAGGAERVMSLVAKNLNSNEFNTTLIVIGYKKDKAYNVDGLNVVYLNEPRVSKSFTKLFRHMSKSRPDVVISCMAHLNTVLALILLCFPKIKLINREANIKKVTALYHLSKKSFFGNILKKITNKRTNAIICQSYDMAQELITEFKIPKSKITTINNPISDEFKLSQHTKNNTVKKYITVGRLHEEKGHLRLLNVLSKLKTPFRYTIIGNGEWKNNIKKHIEKLGLKTQVELIDYTNKIPKYLETSDVFLQGSFAEGFPNALLESCAIGTPVIAFHAIGGTNEIIEHSVNGYLAKDEDEFLHYLKKLNKNPLNSQTVSQSVYSKFNKDLIIKQFEDLIKKVIKQ